MTTTGHRYHGDFARRYYDQGEAKGRAEGEADAVLAVGVWLRRAITADKVQDLGV